MSDFADKIEEITETPAMQRTLNRQLMVMWINNGLVDRAHLDVTRSIVLYDKDRDFLAATTPPNWEIGAVRDLAYSQGARFWSKGIV